MLGKYQGENITLAIYAAELLQMNGTYITDNDILDGISKTFNPGRMEIIAENPKILLDGAHNPTAMKMLEKTLKEDLEYERLILVIGILEDKDINKMLAAITPVSDIIIVTKSTNTRACKPSHIKDKIKEINNNENILVENSIPKAIDHAKIIANKKDIICISGSLFTVGEARKYLTETSKQIITT
jgi:dihydrofolate synthase/folylpolyglutamate synthase